ncbi:STAS domain-containing protein [Neptuniibacter marinus]|uniref:STAS domain-containing protein n=1 Tax=Neptuniibacter marinus TaxID=1806670 RepID=UPI00082A1E32|nr:STAS domain-containing protein [Neptuniibacter marinus]
MTDVRQINEQLISLEGEFRFPVIMQARKKAENILSGCKGIVEIDFSEVTAVDSSALSFWFCCLRYVQDREIQLKAINLPLEMKGIAELVGLEKQFI